jgi:hypothetical protein
VARPCAAHHLSRAIFSSHRQWCSFVGGRAFAQLWRCHSFVSHFIFAKKYKALHFGCIFLFGDLEYFSRQIYQSAQLRVFLTSKTKSQMKMQSVQKYTVFNIAHQLTNEKGLRLGARILRNLFLRSRTVKNNRIDMK